MQVFKKLKTAFGNNRTRLYYIEIDDEGIDKHISEIIIKTKEKIKLFKQHLSESNITLKDTDLNELYELMISIKSEITHLQEDLKRITNMKLKHEQYFVIKDSSFLDDKKQQLDLIWNEVNNFTQIVEQKPSAEEFKNELLQKMISQLDMISASMDRIVKDDFNLRTIYKKLMEI
ncbi:MAG: hypothetical protein ACLFTH_04510 [Candidatus Woesearchaeota archaeon]